jgi:hypothetical protein
VIFVSGTRIEPVLPKVASQIPLNMLPARIVIVQSTNPAGQGIQLSRHQDVVGMVRHERIAGALDLPENKVLALKREIEISFRISKKDITAMVAALSHVMRTSRDHDSSKTRHHP